MWDATTYQLFFEFQGHRDFVKKFIFSDDGKWLISVSMDQTVRIWDITKKAEIKQFSVAEGIPCSVTISPDNQYLVVGSNMGILWIWDVSKDQLLHNYRAHQDEVRDLKYHRGTNAFLSASMDKTVKYWDVYSANLIKSFTEHRGSVSALALAIDGSVMVSGSVDKSMRIWEPITGKEILPTKGHLDYVQSLDLSEDGHYLLSGGTDNSTRLWSVEHTKELNCWISTDTVYAVAFSPDRQRVAIANYSTISIWDTFSGNQVSKLEGHTNRIRWVHFSANGEYLYSTGWDTTIRKWNAVTGALVSSTSTGNSVECASILPSGQLAYGQWNGNIGLLDLQSGQQIQSFKAHNQVVKDLATLEGGKYLISASDDSMLKIWDTALWKPIQSISIGATKKMVSFSTKNTVAIALDNSIEIWSVHTLQKLHTITQETQPLYIIATHDETGFIVGNANGTIYLYAYPKIDPK